MHAPFPAPSYNAYEEGGNVTVEGRTIYRWVGPKVNYDPPNDWRFVSKEFAEMHPNRISEESVPDDPSILNCSIYHEDDDD